MLHGFTGYTRHMRFLAETLHEKGLTVSVPRLPGHGTNGSDFRRSGWRDWLGAATESYIDLTAEGRSVMVCGFSMGGALAVHLAAHFPVHRLALLAPALYTVNRMVPLSPLLHRIVKPYPVREPELRDDPDDQYLAEQYWNWRWPEQTASLYRLMRNARALLPRITAPVLTVVSRGDRAVPLKVADLVTSRCGAQEKRTVHLEESPHLLTTGPEKEIVARELLDWFVQAGA
jgi:carboxylesterase